MKIELEEQHLLDSFRCFKGGMPMLGVKAAWWTKNIEYEERELGGPEPRPWQPTTEQLTIAEWLLFDILLRLTVDDRKMLILRCGRGFKRSYRACGKDVGLHHEVFRQQYQQVIVRLKKILDEVG